MTDEAIIAAMERFGVGPHDFVRAATTPKTLVVFQQDMKLRYRSMVRTVHPDCGGDPEEFKALTAVIEDVMAMRPVERSVERRRFKWAVVIHAEIA